MTDGAHAREVDDLFVRALDLPEGERRAFVERESAGRPALRAATLRLLEAEQASRAPFDAAASQQAAAMARLMEAGDAEDPWQGRRLGPWRLRRRLGQGGMAVVYEAERADGEFSQRVAVKLLRRFVDSAEDLARFRAERQILSALQHPHIAHLIDGGTTDDGWPYLVTELVDGEPLTAHADRHRLGREARIALFLQVVDAVHHAHQNLVVHRDLKPTNVLVDASGNAHLLDFGIAKLLEAEGPDQAPLTRTGHVVMTPEYAAPEQLTQGEITTATDVYQLGVLLHELLTGQRPPRDRPGATSRELRGDLRLVVQTAVQARPGDRYASAAALAADLRAVLAGRPIAARPDRALDLLRRFVRRSPWTSAAAALSLVLMVGWLGSLHFYAGELARERDAAAAQAERARRANELLLGVFRRADPLEQGAAGGSSVTVWDSLDAATRDIRVTLADDPATLAELLETLARLYRVGGQPARALDLLDEALGLRRQTAGPDAAATAIVLGELGAIEWQAGRADAARVHLDEALRIVDALPPAQARAALPVLLDAGHAAIDTGDAQAAVRHFERALALLRTAEPPEANALIESLFGLGNGLRQLGEPQRAEAVIAESVQLTERHFGPDHPRIAGPLSALGGVQRELGRPREAAASLRRAIDVMARAYGPGYAGVLAARNNLALALGEAGDLTGQQRELGTLIDHQRATLGPDHPGLADLYQNLGAVLAQAGQPQAALAPLTEARRIYDAKSGPSSPRPAFPRLTAAWAQLELSQPQAAAREAEAALAILQRTLPAGHFARAIGQCLLGEAALALGQGERGSALVRAALPALPRVPQGQAHYADRCRRVATTLAPP